MIFGYIEAMALYTLGDLHLCFSRPEKDMSVFGSVWKNREKKIVKNCKKIRPEDTLVLTGDHSWGHNRTDCKEDLAFIAALPGRKILLRGNHDMFWDAKKTEALNREYAGSLCFLQNNFYTYEEYALVGTKGIAYEGIDTYEHFEKLRDRELQRLTASFAAAVASGHHRFIMFLHYPPTSVGEQESCFTQLAEHYGVSHVVYSHCHGIDRFDDSFHGVVRGVDYHLVSGDYLNFKPLKLL